MPSAPGGSLRLISFGIYSPSCDGSGAVMEMTRDRSVLFAGLSTQHGCVNSSSHFGGDLNVLGDHLASVPAAAAWKISGDLLPLRAEEQVNDRRD